MTCEHCNTTFVPKPSKSGGNTRFCSRLCARASRRPASDTISKQDKLRANGLINGRIKCGCITRPASCGLCGKECRPDAHHPDYTQPDLVAFLCRSCHMKAHRDKKVERRAATAARATRANRDGTVLSGSPTQIAAPENTIRDFPRESGVES